MCSVVFFVDLFQFDISAYVTSLSELVEVKLGRKTGHFSFGEHFSFSFSFSAVRPKTKMPKYFFVDPSGRKKNFEWPTKKLFS
jgi:hypothetical protein